MKHSIWNIRIPTIAALLFLLAGIGLTSYLVQNRIITIGKAAQDSIPENISLTNITHQSFTVAFTTKEPTNAFLTYGTTDNLTSVANDERDQQGSQKSYYAHSIVVKNLMPNTKYLFEVVSNGTKIRNNNTLFSATTSPSQIISTNNKPVSGRALLPDGSPASDTLVFVQIENAQTLSSVTSKNGEYTINLDTLRSPDLQTSTSLPKDALLTLQLIRGGISSKIQTTYEKSNLIPIISLSKNYDFSKNLPIIQDTQQELELPIPVPPGAVSGTITIVSPKNNASLIDDQPLFQGSANPNEKVKIIIESDPIISEVTTNNNGVWSYRPAQALPPGEHKITIQSKDQFGILKSITQRFNVFAQGSQVTQSATPSATPIVIVTPTPIKNPTTTPFPTPTLTASQIQLSLTPASSLTQTPTLTPTPTLTNSQILLSITPTPTTSQAITPTPTPPSTKPTESPGSEHVGYILTFTSVFLIITGIAFLAL